MQVTGHVSVNICEVNHHQLTVHIQQPGHTKLTLGEVEGRLQVLLVVVGVSDLPDVHQVRPVPVQDGEEGLAVPP